MTQIDQPLRKRPGRPPRVSGDQVVQGALELLAEVPLEQFSLNMLARHLGLSVMALYTYFPSRDALLEAVGVRVFELFEAPKPQDDWQAYLMAWLRALRRHVVAHPVAFKLMGWNGHVGTAWLGVSMPIAELFKAQGLSGRRLALATTWFTTAAVGMSQGARDAGRFRQMEAIAAAGDLPAGQRDAAVEVWENLQEIDVEATEDFLHRSILLPLSELIAEAK
ncbi:MAG TPA: helix-turn-helix domain-containing protein [Alphaproteobacteria bacterium]|nr:helix-turn-helix domain-containing protein [Alphaproteobacteria bacterium]